MGQRLELHDLLKTFVDHVYFQPPADLFIEYPCIVYNRRNVKVNFADNDSYIYKHSYEVTVIDKNPDSDIPHKVLMLPLCSHSRCFAADNLNHDVFTLFF